MKLLVFDSSTRGFRAAVFDGPKCLARLEGTENARSEELSAAIATLLKKCGLGWEDLTAIAFNKGPGSFTGLRIGVMTAKMLGWATKVPLVGISSAGCASPVMSLESIAALARERARDRRFDDPMKLEPHYLHPRTCHVT